MQEMPLKIYNGTERTVVPVPLLSVALRRRE
jgi:hypothetical protein